MIGVDCSGVTAGNGTSHGNDNGDGNGDGNGTTVDGQP